MPSGRVFEWHGADGSVLKLQDRGNGYWVLQGVTGLGKPAYEFDEPANGDAAGRTFYSARAADRQIFLPMEISGPDRTTLLARKDELNRLLDPVIKGPGYLYVTDNGKTYRLCCHYSDGLAGDEGAGATDEGNGFTWQKFGVVLQAVDPYFEDTTDQVLSWGYGGNVPFFPILPIKLNPAQVISDVSQPVRNNHFRNPSLETNLTYWDASWFFGTPAVNLFRDASLSAPGGGAWSLKSASINDPNPSGPSQITAATLTAGNQYTAHAWLYVPSGNSDARLSVVLSVADSLPVTVKDQWVWRNVTFIAPDTSVRVAVLPVVGGVANNWTVYVDKFALTEGVVSDPAEYIDGDQLNCHWTGTAHNSSSYQDALYEPSGITNPGSVDAYPVWTIVGPATQFDLLNRSTNRRLTLNYTLGSGQVAHVDMASSTVKLSDGTSLYRYLAEDDFWPLVPGNNSVSAALTGAGSGSQITVRYKPKYEAIV